MSKGVILNRSRQVPAEETPAFAGIAERFRRAGDLDRAIGLCRDGLKRFPTQLSARVTLGWALLDRGEYDEARTELEQVLRRAPDNLAAIRGLAELHDRTESATLAVEGAQWQQAELAKQSAAAATADAAALATEGVKPGTSSHDTRAVEPGVPPSAAHTRSAIETETDALLSQILPVETATEDGPESAVWQDAPAVTNDVADREISGGAALAASLVAAETDVPANFDPRIITHANLAMAEMGQAPQTAAPLASATSAIVAPAAEPVARVELAPAPAVEPVASVELEIASELIVTAASEPAPTSAIPLGEAELAVMDPEVASVEPSAASVAVSESFDEEIPTPFSVELEALPSAAASDLAAIAFGSDDIQLSEDEGLLDPEVPGGANAAERMQASSQDDTDALTLDLNDDSLVSLEALAAEMGAGLPVDHDADTVKRLQDHSAPAPADAMAAGVHSFTASEGLEDVERELAILGQDDAAAIEVAQWDAPEGAELVTNDAVAAEPVTAEAVIVEALGAEPILAEAVTAEPVVAESVVGEPVAAQPVVARPVGAESVVAEPMVAEAAIDAEPIFGEPILAEPEAVEPVAAKPFVLEPAGAALSRSDEKARKLVAAEALPTEIVAARLIAAPVLPRLDRIAPPAVLRSAARPAEVVPLEARRTKNQIAIANLERFLRKVESRRLQLRSGSVA